MPTITPNLGLKKPLGNENVTRQAYNENLNLLDQNAAKRTEFDAHMADYTTPHRATSTATANKIIIRDASGRAKVAAPSAADDIARKDTVNAVQTNLNTHTADNTKHVTKDGTLQVGLNAEKANGIIFTIVDGILKYDDGTGVKDMGLMPTKYKFSNIISINIPSTGVAREVDILTVTGAGIISWLDLNNTGTGTRVFKIYIDSNPSETVAAITNLVYFRTGFRIVVSLDATANLSSAFVKVGYALV